MHTRALIRLGVLRNTSGIIPRALELSAHCRVSFLTNPSPFLLTFMSCHKKHLSLASCSLFSKSSLPSASARETSLSNWNSHCAYKKLAKNIGIILHNFKLHKKNFGFRNFRFLYRRWVFKKMNCNSRLLFLISIIPNFYNSQFL